jgi:hypothetical protein
MTLDSPLMKTAWILTVSAACIALTALFAALLFS